MKKVMVLMIFMIMAAPWGAVADDDRPVPINELPAKALQFITTHFAGEKISLAKMDKDFFETSYEVFFVNSSKVEFLGNGNWKEIDCRYSRVPESVIPLAINKKINELYPDAYVVVIDKDKHGYELKLNEGIEIKFNNKFNITEIDN